MTRRLATVLATALTATLVWGAIEADTCAARSPAYELTRIDPPATPNGADRRGG